MASSRKSNLPDLTGRVESSISQLLPQGSSILVGLSGGVDSVVLLHLLRSLAPRFGWRLRALHVHHGISPNADSWTAFCADLCAGSGIALKTVHVDISLLRSHGIEAAARKLRHAAFAAESCDFVALAHHADDQVETLFLQLLRGAGIRGASAMPVLSKVDALVSRKRESGVVRPLLHCSRQEILDYADEQHLEWIEDESNADVSYPRNFLRHRLLPQLAEKFPAYRETLVRSTGHFAEAAELLDDLAKIDASGAIEGGTLSADALLPLSKKRAKNLLRYFLHLQRAPMPQQVQLEDMLHQICTARDDAALCVAFGGDWQVRRYRGRIYALRAPGEFDRYEVLQWQGEETLPWAALHARIEFLQAAGICPEKLGGLPVTLRHRQGGEALRIHPDGPSRTLKNLFQEHFVPPWQRDRWPLLYCGDELACVPGIAVAAKFRAEAGVAVVLNMEPH